MASCSANIAASGSFLSQTAALSSTSILTAATDGFYRLTLGGTVTDDLNGVEVSVTLTEGAEVDTVLVVRLLSSLQPAASIVFFAVAGSSFAVSSVLDNGEPVDYNLYYVVESL